MRRAALLLCLLASCGTMRAFKQTAEALADDAIERKSMTAEARETNRRIDALTKRVDAEIVPAVVKVSGAVERTADASTRILKYLWWTLLGSFGGYFSIFKTAGGRWLWKKLGPARKRQARRSQKPPKPA